MSLPGALWLLGHPVQHSLSPKFQDAALRAAGIPLEYTALDVPPDALQSVLEQVRARHAAGNVTVPHKEAAFQACDSTTEIAARIEAVNAFKVEDGRLLGHNTDVAGVDHAVRALVGDPTGLTIALLGAGGAAAAVLAAAESWDADIRMRSRTPERARALAQRVAGVAEVVRRVADALEDADLVINATPIGMTSNAFPCPLDSIPTGAAVLDLVYRPNETRWVREARARGHRAADGMGMLIEQGALAFEWWFGVEPDREVMRMAVR